jgi:phosphoglucomutase
MSLNPQEALKHTLETMILSPSGWRGIFSIDGDEENSTGDISPSFGIIIAAGAAVFADYLKNKGAKNPVVLLGRDTRPTGKATADILIRAFLASGCIVKYTGIAAAPEIMAYARHSAHGPKPSTPPKPGLAPPVPFGARLGFCYISASHNPIGHNGLKFGLDDGAVLEEREANKLIDALNAYLNREDTIDRVLGLLKKAGEERVKQIYAESEMVKKEALEAYRSFSREVIAGAGTANLMKAITGGLKAFPLGIAVDFNGSARTTSIDRELCQSLGLTIHVINGKPGEIVHAIIPEGDSLEQCRLFLEELHRKDPAVIMGYVPDCDGDRGNLVIWDEDLKAGRSLEAQEVFALACVAELAHLVWTGELLYDAKGACLTKAAVAVNGPSSMRIDRIAEAFGVSVFRAEVGEANVVNLARNLRKEGFRVRILGEGSNGGNITYPSAVRDPLSTIFALVKLMAIRSGGVAGLGLFDIWREKIRSAGTTLPVQSRTDTFTLADIIASLPAFTTTGVATAEAKLQVHTRDHALLKKKYQKIFEKEWDRKKAELQKHWGITDWEARACIGVKELRNLADFGAAETGGLKIVFKNSKGREIAFIWMRGSKTEPVFRIMADAEGPPELERELITWQQAMTAGANAAAAANV